MNYYQPLRQPRVLSIESAADALSLSERTIWRLIAASKIKTVQLSSRRKGIPAEEIERIAAEGVAV